MRFRKRVTATAVALTMAVGLVLGIAASQPAGAATTATAATAHPDSTAWLTRTEIESNGWCLTVQPDIRDGEAVKIDPCTNNIRQLWLCGRYRYVGFCAPVAGREILDLGQRGAGDKHAVLVNPHVRGSKFTIAWVELGGSNNWILSLPQVGRGIVLQYSRIRRAPNQYWAWWRDNGAYGADWHLTARWYAA
jgi:hypothetical protein